MCFGVVLLGALILVVLKLGDLKRFGELARHARPHWLLLAVVLQLATYVCTATVWQRALRAAGSPRSLRSLVPLGLAKLFTDQALPSGGLSGTLLLMRGLARRIDASAAGQTLLVVLVSFYSAYSLAALAALCVLALQHRANLLLVVAAAAFCALAGGTVGVIAGLRKWGRLPAWLAKVPGIADLFARVATAPATLLRDTRLIAETVLLQLGVFVLDALTLWVIFLALTQSIGPLTAFTSFIVASVAATLGPTPLGLGTFEGAAVAALHALHVDVEVALAATLLLRGLTFWLPMVPGLWLARREIAPPETT